MSQFKNQYTFTKLHDKTSISKSWKLSGIHKVVGNDVHFVKCMSDGAS